MQEQHYIMYLILISYDLDRVSKSWKSL